MKKTFLATTALSVFLGATSVAAQESVEKNLDELIAQLEKDGLEITYDERNVGSDTSVELVNLVIFDKTDEVTIKADWLKAVPSSSDPELVTFTISDVVSITDVEKDKTLTAELKSDDLEIITNGLAIFSKINNAKVSEAEELAMSLDYKFAVTADSLMMSGGNPDSEDFRKFDLDLSDLDFDLLVAMSEKVAKGTLQTGAYTTDYDYTFDGDAQAGNQSVEWLKMDMEFDIPSSEEEAMGFLLGELSGFIKGEAGPTTYDSTADIDGVSMKMVGTGGDSKIYAAITEGVVTYDAAVNAMDMKMSGMEMMGIPPFDLAMDVAEMTFVMPLFTPNGPKEAKVDILFDQMSIGEGLWAMFDPEKLLPRDPMVMDIDINSMVEVDTNLLMEGADPDMFLLPSEVNINQFLIKAAGATAQANGSVELDFENMGPMGPSADGKINVVLEGLSGLSEKLVELGMIDQMEAGMGLGMMMAFAKAGDKEDQFVSEITFSEEGILANGKPIE